MLLQTNISKRLSIVSLTIIISLVACGTSSTGNSSPAINLTDANSTAQSATDTSFAQTKVPTLTTTVVPTNTPTPTETLAPYTPVEAEANVEGVDFSFSIALGDDIRTRAEAPINYVNINSKYYKHENKTNRLVENIGNNDPSYTFSEVGLRLLWNNYIKNHSSNKDMTFDQFMQLSSSKRTFDLMLPANGATGVNIDKPPKFTLHRNITVEGIELVAVDTIYGKTNLNVDPSFGHYGVVKGVHAEMDGRKLKLYFIPYSAHDAENARVSDNIMGLDNSESANKLFITSMLNAMKLVIVTAGPEDFKNYDHYDESKTFRRLYASSPDYLLANSYYLSFSDRVVNAFEVNMGYPYDQLSVDNLTKYENVEKGATPFVIIK